jgi:hypothetical protein
MGFRGRGTGGRKGTYLCRELGPLKQAVEVLVNEGRDGAFTVHLNINMPLRCAEPPHDVILLEGDLSHSGVRVVEPWIHDPELITWWRPTDMGAAWAALTQRGLPWLEEFADPWRLVSFFESEYARHESAERRPARTSLLARLTGKRGPAPPTPPGAHFQYLLWLSMLYEVQGRLDMARARLESYAAVITERRIVSERDRLERHRELLR